MAGSTKPIGRITFVLRMSLITVLIVVVERLLQFKPFAHLSFLPPVLQDLLSSYGLLPYWVIFGEHHSRSIGGCKTSALVYVAGLFSFHIFNNFTCSWDTLLANLLRGDHSYFDSRRRNSQ